LLYSDPIVNTGSLGSRITVMRVGTTDKKVGSIDERQNEIILKEDAKYGIRFESDGASNKITIHFNWYEV